LIRADFPGGWKDDTINAFTGEGLSADQLSFQAYLKQLLNWRNNNLVIANGQTLHFAPFDGMYVYFRFNNKKTVMVIMNKNDMMMSVDMSRFVEIVQSKSTATNIITNQTVGLQVPLTVAAKTAAVFELK
jgi:neopullulanase